MAIAKVVEIISGSKKGIDDAVQQGVKRATKTLKGVREAWVKSMKVEVQDGKVVEYRVSLMITFVLSD
ncbi:MAG: dodecin family protein [Gemmatimonadales bacterium]